MFPIKTDKIEVTGEFDEPRPLSAPPEKRDHIHGAIDLACAVGTHIVAPAYGYAYYWIGIRHKDGQYFPPEYDIEWNYGYFPFVNYFYDMYGGVIVFIERHTSRVHLFCHSYANQLFNMLQLNKSTLYEEYPLIQWNEEEDQKRFPLFGTLLSRDVGKPIEPGHLIGFTGNAGFSTGPHVHWEIHPSPDEWYPHKDRLNPLNLF